MREIVIVGGNEERRYSEPEVMEERKEEKLIKAGRESRNREVIP